MLHNEEKKGVDMIEIRKVDYKAPETSSLFLGADIGGTNSNFGLFEQKNNSIHLIASYHIKSKTITDFSAAVQQLLQQITTDYSATITHMCIAAAGIITDNRTRCKPTNLSITIDTNQIQQQTSLIQVLLVNDFEVIGYGLEYLDPKRIVTVNKGKDWPHANKVIIGAGTGLGTCIMRYYESEQKYHPVATEAGHMDFAAHTQQELDITNYITSSEQRTGPISYEDILSGSGIGRMYAYFSNMIGNAQVVKQLYPDAIFNARNANQQAFSTFSLYTRVYGRYAKNSALASLALAGVYIAGGIAAKNIDMFKQPEFMQEFTACPKLKDFLMNIPIHVITDYNVSLWGSAHYMINHW